MSKIVVDRVSHTFPNREGGLRVLEDVSFRVLSGEVATVLGPSGCGKSTLLRFLGDLLAPTSGTVTIDELPASTLRSKRELGFGFQEPSLMDWRTVEENIALPMELGKENGVTQTLRARVDELLEIVQMSDFRDSYPAKLSGGMKHRTALARALVLKPKVLLLDEPLAGLDLLTRRELMGQLGVLLEKQQCTTVIVTHSVEEAVFWGDRIILLSHRPASVIRIVEHSGERPRGLAFSETDAFHKLVDECSELLLSLKDGRRG